MQCRIGVEVALREMDVARLTVPIVGQLSRTQRHWQSPQPVAITTPGFGVRAFAVGDVHRTRNEEGVGGWRTERGKNDKVASVKLRGGGHVTALYVVSKPS